LTTEILKIAENTPFYELHDRLILATTKWIGIPVLSSDKRVNSVDGIEAIWH